MGSFTGGGQAAARAPTARQTTYADAHTPCRSTTPVDRQGSRDRDRSSTSERAHAIKTFHRQHHTGLLCQLRQQIPDADAFHETALAYAWHQLTQRPDLTLDLQALEWLHQLASAECHYQVMRSGVRPSWWT